MAQSGHNPGPQKLTCETGALLLLLLLPLQQQQKVNMRGLV